MSKAIRISEKNYNLLNELESKTGLSKQLMVEQAIEKLYREIFLKELSQDYDNLKNSDPKAWEEMIEEQAEWDLINDIPKDL